MSDVVENAETNGKLPTPYNVDSFQKRLNQFQQLIRHLTLQDVEATAEERRQQITGLKGRLLLQNLLIRAPML